MISFPFQRILSHQIQQILDQLRSNVHSQPLVISAEVLAIKSYVASLGCRTGSYRLEADCCPIDNFVPYSVQVSDESRRISHYVKSSQEWLVTAVDIHSAPRHMIY
jgi:hypothetical protein